MLVGKEGEDVVGLTLYISLPHNLDHIVNQFALRPNFLVVRLDDAISPLQAQIKQFLRFANCIGGLVFPVFGVEVADDDVVLEFFEYGECLAVCGEEGWAHVVGEEAEHVCHGVFEEGHFGAYGGGGEGGEVCVTPSGTYCD